MTIEICSKDSSVTEVIRERAGQRQRFVLDHMSGVIEIYESKVDQLPPTTEEEDHPPGWAFF
jgi:hypothetical protein